MIEQLETRSLLAADTLAITDSLLQNHVNPYDTNNDGLVSAIDLLVVINHLNARASEPGAKDSVGPDRASEMQFPDVNGDKKVTNIDLLREQSEFNRLTGNQTNLKLRDLLIRNESNEFVNPFKAEPGKEPRSRNDLINPGFVRSPDGTLVDAMPAEPSLESKIAANELYRQMYNLGEGEEEEGGSGGSNGGPGEPPFNYENPTVSEVYYRDSGGHWEVSPFLWSHNDYFWSIYVHEEYDIGWNQYEGYRIDWVAAPWVYGQSSDSFNPSDPFAYPNQVFTSSYNGYPNLGLPGIGFWGIHAVLMLGDNEEPVAVSSGVRFAAVMQVTNAEWKGVAQNDNETNFYPNNFEIPGNGQSFQVGGVPYYGNIPISDAIYPEKNIILGTSSLSNSHDKVKLKVTVNPSVPASASVTFRYKIVDPDHIENEAKDPGHTFSSSIYGSTATNATLVADAADTFMAVDNVSGQLQQSQNAYSLGMNSEQGTIVISGGTNSGESADIVITQPQPGNNWRAVVHEDAEFRDNVAASDNQVRWDDAGLTPLRKSNFYYPPISNYTSVDIPPMLLTRILTVKRKLWIEWEQMLAPQSTDGIFNGDEACKFGTNDSSFCDDPMTQPELPDISLLTTLLSPALIDVEMLPYSFNPSFQNGNMDFVQYVFTGTPNNQGIYPSSPGVAEADDNRDIYSSQEFWEIQLVGSYEYGAFDDNDPTPNDAAAMFGYAIGADPPGNDGPTMVFYEAIRDHWFSASAAVRATWFDKDGDGGGDSDEDYVFMKDSTAAHEALHRFFGVHGNSLSDTGIMSLSLTTPYNEFVITTEQFRALQNTSFPK